MAETGAMDFFAHQDAARRKTGILIVYYLLAVFLIISAIYAVSVLIFGLAENGMEEGPSTLWNPTVLLWVTIGSASVIIGGTLFKIAQLSQGGEAVARMLGGRLIPRSAANLNERKVLNVVEEMAIASGIQVPPVFLLENEQGINAFAAGFTPNDAVIGITRGCMEQLTRDELQGVVAHEFSHILNGDMRLNIKLMGVLHGILVIALMGYGILRSAAFSGRSSSRSRNKDNSGAALMLFGFSLMAIGYIGVFFGKLIKSAVSRQREYLADASAVQFTRNPFGISGALKKIGGFSEGSRLQIPAAEEAGHFFFSNGLASSFSTLMATHPPLEERIRRLDPAFAGRPGVARSAEAVPASAAVAGLAGDSSVTAPPQDVVSRIGTLDREHVDYAAKLVASLPDAVADAARNPFGARAVAYLLLLNREDRVRQAQLGTLSRNADPAVYQETLQLLSQSEKIAGAARLPLLDMALGSLRELSQPQFRKFMENVELLAKADEQIDLFEYTLYSMIRRHLEPAYTKVKPERVQYHTAQAVLSPCVDLLSSLAYWGSDDHAQAERAFQAGLAELGIRGARIAAYEKSGLGDFDNSLKILNRTSAGVKRQIVKACSAAILMDGKVTIEEAELLRAVADSLGCPVPPFLPDRAAG